MLVTTGSAINGSVVRRLLAQQSNFLIFASTFTNRFDRSANLNVITLHNQLESCKTWLKNNGYVIWNRRTVALAYCSIVKEVWVGEQPQNVHNYLRFFLNIIANCIVN